MGADIQRSDFRDIAIIHICNHSAIGKIWCVCSCNKHFILFTNRYVLCYQDCSQFFLKDNWKCLAPGNHFIMKKKDALHWGKRGHSNVYKNMSGFSCPALLGGKYKGTCRPFREIPTLGVMNTEFSSFPFFPEICH